MPRQPQLGFKFPNRLPKSRKAFRRACRLAGVPGRTIRGLSRELYPR